jgi:mono/diheme cytochrome c family protein
MLRCCLAGAAAFALLVWAAARNGPPPELPDPEPGWTEVAIEPPTRPAEELLEAGERLYGWNCLPCHGPDGKGDGPNALRLGLRPRNYTRGLFKFKTSPPGEMPFDEDLYRTLVTGIPAAGMPPFPQFTPDDRWALIAHVRSLSQMTLEDGTVIRHFERNPARRKLDLPPPPPGVDRIRGAGLFMIGARCAQCHGHRGKGDGIAAAGLVDAFDRPERMPDMTRGPVTFKAGARLRDVYRVLTTGMAGSPMPSFASLPERDRWDLARFVTGLYEPVPEGEFLYLKRGCAACHTVGRGKLVGPDLAGVMQRRTEDWLRRWLADPPLMMQDPQVKALFPNFPVTMPNLALTEREIELLLEYFRTLPPGNP